MEANETPTGQTGSMADAGRAAAMGIADVSDRMSGLIERFAGVARADACVGPVQTTNGHTVIPIATVGLQAGFGMGFGGGGGGEGNTQGQGSGGGGGGGGRSSARTIAVVDVSESGVDVRPVLDMTTIILAVLALLGLGLISRRGRNSAAERRLAHALHAE